MIVPSSNSETRSKWIRPTTFRIWLPVRHTSKKGSFDLAIAELRIAVVLSHGTPLLLSALAHAYPRAGNRAEAGDLLSQMSVAAKNQYVSPYYSRLFTPDWATTRPH